MLGFQKVHTLAIPLYASTWLCCSEHFSKNLSWILLIRKWIGDLEELLVWGTLVYVQLQWESTFLIAFKDNMSNIWRDAKSIRIFLFKKINQLHPNFYINISFICGKSLYYRNTYSHRSLVELTNRKHVNYFLKTPPNRKHINYFFLERTLVEDLMLRFGDLGYRSILF